MERNWKKVGESWHTTYTESGVECHPRRTTRIRVSERIGGGRRVMIPFGYGTGPTHKRFSSIQHAVVFILIGFHWLLVGKSVVQLVLLSYHHSFNYSLPNTDILELSFWFQDKHSFDSRVSTEVPRKLH